MNEDHVRAAYRIPKERCAHVKKLAASLITHNGKKGGKNAVSVGKITAPPDCAAETDVTCLNSFSFSSLPARSNWPTGRLKACLLGAEPQKAQSAEELCHQQPSGIPNLGNTCYANSVMQCLARIGMDWSRPTNNHKKKVNAILDGSPRFLDNFVAAWSPSQPASAVATPAKNNNSNNKNRSNNEDDANATQQHQQQHEETEEEKFQGHLNMNNTLRSMFSKLRCVYGEKISLDKVMEAFAVDVYEQQDAQEFYVLLLSTIEPNHFDAEQCKPFIRLVSKDGKSTNAEAANDARTFVNRQMMRHMTAFANNELTCLHCNCVTSRNEALGLGGIPLHTAPSLEAAIKRLLQAEADPTSTFNCEQCEQKNVNFATQYRFTKLPPVVCFHLLRFRYDPATGTRVKVQDRMRIPEFLDLFELCGLDPNKAGVIDVEALRDIRKFRNQQEQQNNNNKNKGKKTKFLYRLQCSVLHRGASAIRGHYIAYVRGHDEENNNNNNNSDLVNWWCCDDDSVRRLKNPLFNKVTLPNNNNHNNSSMASQMQDLYGKQQHSQPPGGEVAIVGATSALSKAQKRKNKQNDEQRFNDAKAEIEGKQNKEDIVPGTDNSNQNNNNNNMLGVNFRHDDFPSNHVAWTSDEAFMVWYELCEVDDDDDEEDQNEENEIHQNTNEDDDGAKTSSKKKGNNNTTSKNNNKAAVIINLDEDAAEKNITRKNNNNTQQEQQFDDSILYLTPERIWPKDLLRQCRVSVSEMERMRKDYDARLARAQPIFEAWRNVAAYLSKGADDKMTNWIALNMELQGDRDGSYYFYAIPDAWLQQLRAASVRDSDFTDADTTADISSVDVLFSRDVFIKDKITCDEHDLSGFGNKVIVAASGSKNKNNSNNNSQQQHLRPLSPFRLVHPAIFNALSELIFLLHPHRVESFGHSCTFTLPCSPSGLGNGLTSPSAFACSPCVRQRIDDISSNKEAEQRYEKMRGLSFALDGKSVGAIVAQTSLGKSNNANTNNKPASLIDDEDDDANNNNQNNSNVGTESPMYISKAVRDLFTEAKTAVEKSNNSNNASIVEHLRPILHAQDLSAGLVCQHNELNPHAPSCIIPRAVFDYLVKEFSCFASIELPLWYYNNNSQQIQQPSSPSPVNNNKNSKKTNASPNNKKGKKNVAVDDDADTLLHDDDDNDDEDNNNNKNPPASSESQSQSIITREACPECANASIQNQQKLNEEKHWRMKELAAGRTFLDNPAASNDRVLKEKLKDVVKKYRQSWKEQEQARIASVMKERRDIAESKARKEAAIQQSGIKFTAGRGGGAGRGGAGRGGGGRGGAAKAAEVVDVDAEDANKREDSPVLQDAAVNENNNKTKQPATASDPELIERDPEPRIQQFALISYAFVKQWQRYVHQNPSEFFTNSLVSSDGEAGQDPCHHPLLENYSLRCGCKQLSAIDVEDLERLVKELNPPGTKLQSSSSGSSGKGKNATFEVKPTVPSDRFTAVIVPMSFLEKTLFDLTGEVRRASNLDFQTFKRDHLVTFVQRDEEISIEPSPCPHCIQARREAQEVSETVFDDGTLDIKVELPVNRRGTKSQEIITLESVSSDCTLSELYRVFFDAVASEHQCYANDRTLFRLKLKGHSNDLPQDDNEVIVNHKIRRTGTELKCVAIAGGDWERKKLKDLENEQLEQAMRNSLNADMNAKQRHDDDPFAIALGEDGAATSSAAKGGRGNSNSNNKNGGRQKGTVVQVTAVGDTGRAAFGSSRLGGGGGGNNNTNNNGNKKNNNNAEIACPVCTFLNAPGMRSCEMCGTQL